MFITINVLIAEKKQLITQLNSMLYGTLEVREKNKKKYIYVHFRKNGILITKYAGEYSDILYNLIVNNNNHVKEIKKRIKEIDKKLKTLNYIENDHIDNMVAMNIDLAKKNIVDLIYKQSILEGIATTYSDTETLINGGEVNNMQISDVYKIVNLKRSWEFILSIPNYPTNYVVLCQINQIVIDGFYFTAGKIRKALIKISGSSYIPSIPFESQVKQDLSDIFNSQKSGIDLAIDLVLYVVKKQLFIDGNKRTAIIFANHYLISHALGLIVVPTELVDKYKKLLILYYEDENKKNEIAHFLKNKCWIRL